MYVYIYTIYTHIMNVYHIIEQITGLFHTHHLLVGFPPATNLSVVEMGLGIGKLGIKSLCDLLDAYCKMQ